MAAVPREVTTTVSLLVQVGDSEPRRIASADLTTAVTVEQREPKVLTVHAKFPPRRTVRRTLRRMLRKTAHRFA